MARQHHYLKTETQFYQSVERGEKTWEVRFNDRDYKVGDMIYLDEVVQGVPTGRQSKQYEITYIYEGRQYGLKDGFVIFSIK